MPVPGWPNSVEFIDYKNTQTLEGSSGSTYTLVCAYADMLQTREQMFGSVDGFDPTLLCVDFSFVLLNDDPATGMYRCESRFIPAWRYDKLLPDEPFYVYLNFSSQDITLPTKAWTWASGDPINNQISPIKTIAITQITLKGTKTGVDLGKYSAYADTVNSDTFLGMAAGYVIFRTAAVSPRYVNTPNAAPTSILTNDVEIRLEARNIPWNNFFNETTGLFEAIKDPSGNPMFASTAFTPLLANP